MQVTANIQFRASEILTIIRKLEKSSHEIVE